MCSVPRLKLQCAPRCLPNVECVDMEVDMQCMVLTKAIWRHALHGMAAMLRASWPICNSLNRSKRLQDMQPRAPFLASSGHLLTRNCISDPAHLHGQVRAIQITCGNTIIRFEAAAVVTSVTAAPWKLSHLPFAVLIMSGFGPTE